MINNFADDIECMIILYKIELYFCRVAIEEIIILMQDVGEKIKENLE